MTRAPRIPFATRAEVEAAQIRFRFPRPLDALFPLADEFMRTAPGSGDAQALLSVIEFFAPRGLWRVEEGLDRMDPEAARQLVMEARHGVDLACAGAWERGLTGLCALPGVAYPVASGVIMAARRGDFPVLSEQSLAGLGLVFMRAPGRKTAEAAVRAVTAGAAELGVPVRTLDYALWARGEEVLREAA